MSLRPKRTHRYSYKPVHPVKAGPQSVTGSLNAKGSGDCWCGKASDHEWEGKDDGKPHPR